MTKCFLPFQASCFCYKEVERVDSSHICLFIKKADPDLCLHLIHQDGVPRPLPLAMREIEKASFGRGWERVWRFETGVSHQVCHRSHRFLSNMNIILDISEYQKPRKFRLISDILPELRHR